MNVTTVKTEIMDVGKGIAKDSATMFDWWDTFDYIPIKVAIVVLREVDKIGGAVVIYSNIDTWKLVQTNIMIAYYTDNRHQIAKSCS